MTWGNLPRWPPAIGHELVEVPPVLHDDLCMGRIEKDLCSKNKTIMMLAMVCMSKLMIQRFMDIRLQTLRRSVWTQGNHNYRLRLPNFPPFSR